MDLRAGGDPQGWHVSLRWADVDVAGLRIRLPKSATKSDRSRWVYLPDWLMEAIEATCPLEDRVPEQRVFQGLQLSAARQAMTRAIAKPRCRTTRRTISGTVASRSGISRVFLLGNSRSVQVTRGRP